MPAFSTQQSIPHPTQNRRIERIYTSGTDPIINDMVIYGHFTSAPPHSTAQTFVSHHGDQWNGNYGGKRSRKRRKGIKNGQKSA